MIDIRPPEDDDSGLDMTPIIDVVFILLIFFIIAASFSVRGMHMDLPQAQSTQALSGRVVEIHLTADDAYRVDGVPVARDELPYRLHTLVRSFRTQPAQLVLIASPEASAGALIYLVDQVKQNGGENLMLAARDYDKGAP